MAVWILHELCGCIFTSRRRVKIQLKSAISSHIAFPLINNSEYYSDFDLVIVLHDAHVHSEHILCTGIETMDEQQITREEQGVARHREQQRERRARARARAEETPEQREQRLARRREQDRKL